MADETYTREELMALANYLLNSKGAQDGGDRSGGEDQVRKRYPFKAAGPVKGGDVDDRDPIRGNKPHTGMDISPANGLAQAAAEGEVIYASDAGDFGKTVIVRHADGTQTQYSHLANIKVRVGDVVAYGDPLGRVGSTGLSTGAHLHFEWNPAGTGIGVRSDGTSSYPLNSRLMSNGPVTPHAGTNPDPDYPEGQDPTLPNEAETSMPDGTSGDMIRKKNPGKFSEDLPSQIDQFLQNPPSNGLSATDLLGANTRDFSSYRSTDQAYYLPWGDSELGGDTRASRNTLRGMGFNPDSGNPYTKFLQDRATDMGRTASILQLMNGEESDYEGGISDRVAGALRSGNDLDSSQIGAFVKDLATRYANGDETLTEGQRTFAQAMNDKGTAIPFAESILRRSINPYVRKSLRDQMLRQYDTWLDRAPADPNAPASFLGFVLGR